MYVLAALCVGAVIAAILVVGPASGSQATITRTAKVARGVVQSTVSGSGNLQPASQLDLGFQTAGTVTHIYVKQGEQVAQGQLLATLDPEPAEVTLEQARADLLSARASLAKEEETNGEGAAGQGSGAQGSGGQSSNGSGGRASSSSSSSSSSAASKPTVSAATREANLASAHAAVSSAELTVQSDEQALAHTKLYAPQDGTIVSLAGQVGEVVSASGTTKSSSASSGSSGSGSSGSGAGASGRSGSGSSASASSGSGSSGAGASSSSSSFAVLSDLESMQLVVPLAESEIASVHPGQIATVTVEALAGRKLAAHVHEVATLSSTNSGVVSYDVTFQLDQLDPALKPGMTASAEVVVKQSEGLNVPTSAISGGSVTVIRAGQHVRQPIVTGLAGNTSTIVLSGVHEGETVLLPTVSTSSAGSSSLGSARRGLGGLGGAGALGGLGGGGGGGGGVVFRSPG